MPTSITALDINGSYTRDQAELKLYRDGLTNDQTSSLFNSVFSGCPCAGGNCYDDNTSGTTMVSYAQRDDDGNIIEEKGKEITHAGVIVAFRGSGEDMEMQVHSNTGLEWVPIADRRMCFFATDINTGYQCDGSGIGSSDSNSNGGSSCGSGSGSDGGSSGSGSW